MTGATSWANRPAMELLNDKFGSGLAIGGELGHDGREEVADG
ncbi:hypothetical protein [Micromonospora sp. MH33]|nr:hypothetical protein [Micromonospora sp. MH33]